MTRVRVLPPLWKEIRALLPIWLGCLGALACLTAARAGAAIDGGSAQGLGLFAYGVTAIALGAFSIGHEYTYRTLPEFLCQPRRRASALLTKLAVLGAMLITLAGAVWGSVIFPSGPAALFVLAAVPLGLFVAPWLTMLCRNPVAGTVFTIVIPGLLWLLVNALVGHETRMVAFARGMQGLAAIAAVMCWVTFMRLEAVEGRGTDLRWPTAGAAPAAARPRHPIWLLVKKELGLQQLALALGVLYIVIWLAVVAMSRTVTGPVDPRDTDLFRAAALMYCAMLALLIGALTSAEERQLGTADWQALLPMSSLRQWQVKAAVAIALALLLSVGLPALLLSISGLEIGVGPWYVAEIVMLTVCALYVSSLCSNGVRALVLSLAPAAAATLTVGWLPRTWSSPAPPLVVLAVFVALALYFALQNHRTAERGVRRVAVQVFWLAGCPAFCVALLAAESVVYHR